MSIPHNNDQSGSFCAFFHSDTIHFALFQFPDKQAGETISAAHCNEQLKS
jgi:hypothetical protein